MLPNGNIPVATLYEKVSKNGKTYMVGRWGRCRVLLFQGKPTDDGTPTWSLELQEAGEYQPYQPPQHRQPNNRHADGRDDAFGLPPVRGDELFGGDA